MSVRFSIFDWLDETGRDQGESYAERLRFVECADRLGLYAYHLAEHHRSEVSTVPSPNPFLFALAPHTPRLLALGGRLLRCSQGRLAPDVPRGLGDHPHGPGHRAHRLPRPVLLL